ncbi:MAG: DNA internalization-related competence protein ComEC/Rec2, partial [Rhodoferax sp.]|nr:DNA internalization-related competence protein ComEC/Rec2 [Rhodoferax sp.]
MDTEPSDRSAWGGGWVPGLLGFVAGTAVQLQQPQLWSLPIYGSFCLTGLVLYGFIALESIAPGWRRRPARQSGGRSTLRGMGGATGWVIGLAALGFGLAGGRASLLADEALAPGLEGQDLVLTGVVAAMPQVSEVGLRFRLEVESARWQGRAVTVPSLLDLSWYSGLYPGANGLPELQRQPQPLVAGERWRFTARLKAAHGGVNPHGFDYELWLWEQGVLATGSLRTGRNDPPPERLGSTWRHPVEAARQQVRARIALALPQRSEGGLVAALVVGDQRAIDRADWDVFRATGVAHLMSISGLHITLFAWLAAGLVSGLWRRSSRLCLAYPAPLAALWCGLALAAAYALFSGWGVPAQRTVLMLAAVTLLRASGRQWPWPIVWLLVCAVVTAADPWALLQPGFWLSFVAVGVLFASSGSSGRAVRDGRLAGPAARIGASAVAMLREQWVITLALTPLTLLLFGQVSLVGLVANALAIPWVTLLVTPLAMLGVIWPPLWSLAALAVQGMTQVLQALAVLPWAVWSTAQAPLWAGVAGMLGGLLLVLRLPLALRLCGLPLVLPVLLWQPVRPPPGEFELLAADIGQGNAVLVRTAHHALLYDAGPRYSRESDAGHRVLVPLLRALDVRLDRLVLSHRDTNHVGGAAAVLAQQPQARLVSTFQDRVDLASLRQAEPCEA